MADPTPSSALAGIRERIAQVAAADLNADAFGGGPYASAVRLARDDAPRLVAALEAALELHRPVRDEPVDGICRTDTFAWPCPTYRAITTTLTGTENPSAPAAGTGEETGDGDA